MSLFPAFTPLRGAALNDRIPTYPRGYQWDFTTGDLALDGAGRVIQADGYTAWVIWCAKAIAVERYAFPIYSRQYGTELEETHNLGRGRGQAQATIIRTITEALKRDPRTGRVVNFSFEQSPEAPEALTVNFIAEPVVGSSTHIRLLIKADK
jgi:hypothetical protein